MDFVLKVTGEEVNLLGAALGKLPYENVAKLITSLTNQIQEQQGAISEPTPVSEPCACE